MGFSAGGHLAASLGTLWNDSELALPADCRPDAMLLCYPVISLLEHTHRATSDNVSAGDEALLARSSILPPQIIGLSLRLGAGFEQVTTAEEAAEAVLRLRAGKEAAE